METTDQVRVGGGTVGTASLDELLAAVRIGTADGYESSRVRQAACEEIKRRLDAAHDGLKRALDYRSVTPEGLRIKDDVRKALVESGCPPGHWGEVGL